MESSMANGLRARRPIDVNVATGNLIGFVSTLQKPGP
jgi:hypothetical protein